MLNKFEKIEVESSLFNVKGIINDKFHGVMVGGRQTLIDRYIRRYSHLVKKYQSVYPNKFTDDVELITKVKEAVRYENIEIKAKYYNSSEQQSELVKLRESLLNKDIEFYYNDSSLMFFDPYDPVDGVKIHRVKCIDIIFDKNKNEPIIIDGKGDKYSVENIGQLFIL